MYNASVTARPTRLAWLSWALAAAAGPGLVAFCRIGDSDAGWHLALGRRIAGGAFPRTNALTWTATDVPWYDTSWLWDWATYLAQARFGLFSLQLITWLFFAAALCAVAFACARRGTPGVVVAVALLLVPRLAVRPHVATWTGLAVVVALCELGTLRARLLCVLVIAFAGNLHSGAPFAAGVLGFYCLQEFLRTRGARELAIAAAGVLALCANPGGLFNLTSLVWHLRVREVVVIEEYLRPTLSAQPLFFLLLPAALLLAWRGRRERPAELAIVVVFGALGLQAYRMDSEFAIVTAPLFAGALEGIGARFGRNARSAALGALTLAAIFGYRGDLTLRRLDLAAAWDAQAQPVRAVEFARAHRIGGHLFNGYSAGGYLEWALPESPSFVDGRVQCFPPGFFPAFYRAGHGAREFDAWLRSLGVDWALTSRQLPWLSGRSMLDRPGWALVYWDATDEIWLRRDAKANAALLGPLEYRHFLPRGSVVRSVAETAAGDLPAYAAEVERYEATTAEDPFAAVVRCALAARFHRGVQAECERAAALAPGPEVAALVRSAATLR